jgi:ABC-type multidrug transport system fused ATPase/permease subunit
MIQTLLWALRLKILGLLFFLILGFLGRGLLLSTANLLGSWVDFLISSPGSSSGFNYLESLIIFVTLGFFVTWIYRIGFSDLCALMVSEIYDEVTYRVSRYPMKFFDTTPVGRIMTRFSSDYGHVFRLFGGPLAEFLSIIFDLLWMVGLLIFANPRFLPFIFLSFIGHTWIYKKFQKDLKKNRQDLSHLRGPSLAHFSESLQGATSIRIFGRESSFVKRFLDRDFEYLKQKIKTITTLTQFTLWLNLLSFFLYLTLALFSWWGVYQGFLTIGQMGVAFGLVTLSSNTIQMFFEWLAQFEEALVGLERLNGYLRLPLEMGEELPVKALFPTPEHEAHRRNKITETSGRVSGCDSDRVSDRVSLIQDVLCFDSVYFRYSEERPWVLQNVSFQIPLQGARLGVVGRTGAGKSSLIQCLFQLYPLSQGSIHIGPYLLPHRELSSKQSLTEIRHLFSYIPQDPLLFKGTLRSNLDPDSTLSDSQIASIFHEWNYSSWAENLAMPIEEKGQNLSSGEKQLVQLARVLIQNRPILVMDEATSNIDPSTEKTLLTTLEEKLQDKLQIIIAHRLETLLSCTHILWLDQGQVKMWGPPEKVLPFFRSQGLPS